MRLVLKDNIVEKLNDQIRQAITDGFEIEKIVLNESELVRLCDQIGNDITPGKGLHIYYYQGYKIEVQE